MGVSDLVERARAAAGSGGTPAPELGLEPLAGGMTHAVFAPLDDATLVVKVFTSVAGDEPPREWEALVALSGTGLAPEPVHFEAGDPPVVVMTRVAGVSLRADELDERHALAIGAAHRRVHRIEPSVRRPLTHAWVRAACASLLDEADPTPDNDASEIFTSAWAAARRWVTAADVDRILGFDTVCFSRGDPNLTNYLWGDGGPVLIDWENSGDSDRVLELADVAEHASTRDLQDEFWTALADATGLTANEVDRVADARRVIACFWLVLIATRQRAGRPTTVTLDEQARRTLWVLDR